MKSQHDTQFSTIAELVFVAPPTLNFARLVGALDTVLARFSEPDRSLTWDCEDLASFDMPGTRIVLALADHPRRGIAASLTISVGPSALPAPSGPPVRHAALCSKLVERVQARLGADAVFWHESAAPVEADLIDHINANPTPLPNQSPDQTHDHPIRFSLDDRSVEEIFSRSLSAANDHPDVPRPRDPELARLRAALYPPPAPVATSTPMRLAVHTMNATLIMVWLPVGAAMLTYSVLKGDNLRLTTAALVATGFSGLLLQNPLVQHFATLNLS